MAHQNTINQIANRLATALAHHLRENETLDVAQTQSLEEEVVETLYEQLAEVGFIPKNSCDEPLFGTQMDESVCIVGQMGAEIERLKAENAEHKAKFEKLMMDWRDAHVMSSSMAERCEQQQDYIDDVAGGYHNFEDWLEQQNEEIEALKAENAELKHREGLGGGD